MACRDAPKEHYEEQIRAFSQPDSWEHLALERVSPVSLREGSEGGVVRALALLGMAYVREHTDVSAELAVGYEELARERAEPGAQPTQMAPPSGLRANMARRARPGLAASPR
jgi:hypothetical protein